MDFFVEKYQVSHTPTAPALVVAVAVTRAPPSLSLNSGGNTTDRNTPSLQPLPLRSKSLQL